MLNTLEKRESEGTAEARRVQSACSSSNIADGGGETKKKSKQKTEKETPKQHLPSGNNPKKHTYDKHENAGGTSGVWLLYTDK